MGGGLYEPRLSDTARNCRNAANQTKISEIDILHGRQNSGCTLAAPLTPQRPRITLQKARHPPS
jgi:hypothetical protein